MSHGTNALTTESTLTFPREVHGNPLNTWVRFTDKTLLVEFTEWLAERDLMLVEDRHGNHTLSPSEAKIAEAIERARFGND